MSFEALALNRKAIDSTMILLKIIIIIITIVIISLPKYLSNRPNTTFLRFYFAKYKRTTTSIERSKLDGNET